MYFGETAEPRDTTGCRKTAILSAEELFHWRKKEVLPVPQRGGIKDFEPDGSWLQDKRLETFCDEYSDVIAEPRVEKSGNLVKGTWNADMKLVNIEKTAKFWMKMGFADNDRNWLHPEEALFLMEVNCLDLVHHGVSLSLQQAYSLLLHQSDNVSEEEYQVYAHLRRLGYIVLRHAGKLDVTDYEMKIGLHNYTKKKNKKRSRKAKEQTPGDQVDPAAATEQQHTDSQHTGPDPGNVQQNNSSTVSSTNNRHAKGMCLAAGDQSSSTPGSASAEIAEKEKHSKNNVSCDNCERQRELSKGEADNERLSEERKSNSVNCDSPVRASKNSSSELPRFSKETNCKNDNISEQTQSTQNVHKRTNNAGDDSANVTEPCHKRARMNSHNDSSSSTVSQEPDHPCYSNPWSEATKQSLARTSRLKLTEWDFSTVRFPDIGGKDTVWLTTPPPDCLPPNTCMDEEYEDVCMFDVEEYRRQQQLQQPSCYMDQDDNKRHLRQLDFSYGEWYMKNCRPMAARNWKEWKEGLRLREKSFLLDSPVAHLWQGEVTPLVQPVHAESTNALLSRLSVIQPFQGPFVAKERQEEAVKISYDVYLPNTTFRKSSPGLPDHRVCVARGPEPPDVFDVHAATAHLDDGVALHWAVVSSGDICFFVLEDVHLPVHPSSLG